MGDIDAVLLNAVNRAGNTPLHYAASLGSREMVHYLLEVTSEDTILATGDELLLRLTTGELYDPPANSTGWPVNRSQLWFAGLELQNRQTAGFHRTRSAACKQNPIQ